MAREVDPRRTRKAKRLIDKLQREKDEAAEPYSGWEDEFLNEVGERLEKYGSAFHDLSKGAADAALSNLQAQKLKEIAAKAAGKSKAQRRAAKAGAEESAPEKPRRYSSFRPKART